jgi:23S rRNA pseudouridine955/2504/2580 synthase
VKSTQNPRQARPDPAPGPESGGAKALPAASGGVQQVDIDAGHAGQRIDNFLLGRFKGAPRSLVYRLLRTGQVRINGGRAKPEVRLQLGDRVRLPPVRLGEPDDPVAAPAGLLARLEQAIVFEDRNVLVLDKPSGLASHGGSGIRHGAIEALRELRAGQPLELLHRLDRDTSGVLVLTKTRVALLALQAQLRAGRARKQYLTLLAGRLEPSPFRVEAALRKQVLQGGERMVQVAADGKPSTSVFTARQRFAGATLAEVLIETGRTHQIRVHARHIRHPVAGDDKYGDADFNARMKAVGLRRLFLHAASLRIAGPGGEDYLFHAPLPPDLGQALDALANR